MDTIKVLIVDDHAILREGLRSLLALNERIKVIGEAGNGIEAAEKVRELRPDVVLMDIAMPKMDGLEATRRIRKEYPFTKVLVLTQHDNRQYVFRILKAGASGYILKRTVSTNLIAAIEEVSNGNRYLDPGVTDMVIDQCLQSLPDDGMDSDYGHLSDREREILKLVAEGNTNQEIADLLCISINTVLTHRTSLMRKLSIHNRSDLIKYAIRTGLIAIDIER